jgi:hypothetical protein
VIRPVAAASAAAPGPPITQPIGRVTIRIVGNVV